MTALGEGVHGLELEQHDLGLLAQLRRLPGARCLAELLDGRLDSRPIAHHRRAHAEGEELVDALERSEPLHLFPSLAFDDVARPHRAAIVAQRLRTDAAPDRAVHVVVPADLIGRPDVLERLVHQRQCAGRLPKAAELRPLVVQPRQAVEVAHGAGQPAAGGPLHRGIPRGAVGGGGLFPVSQLHERMGGHVQGVTGRRRDGGIGARGGEAPGRQRAMVVGMEDVVRGAGMFRVPREHGFRDRARLLPHRQRLVPARQHCEDAQRVEQLRFIVRGECRGELAHGVRVLDPALARVASAPQLVHRRQVALLPCRLRLGAALSGSRAELAQHRAALVGLLLEPQRLAETERLSPVGQGEGGVDFLRFLEGLDGVFVAKTVEPRHAAQERCLSGGGAGVGERQRAERRDRARPRRGSLGGGLRGARPARGRGRRFRRGSLRRQGQHAGDHASRQRGDESEHGEGYYGLGTWGLGLGTWDLGLGAWGLEKETPGVESGSPLRAPWYHRTGLRLSASSRDVLS